MSDPTQQPSAQAPALAVKVGFLRRNSVEVSAAVIVVAVVGALTWWWPSNRTRQTLTVAPTVQSSAGAPALAGGLPAAPTPGAIAVIDAEGISSEVLQATLKNPAWLPVAGRIGQYVGAVVKQNAKALAAKGWVVLPAGEALAFPASRDFTAQVREVVQRDLSAHVQTLLAQVPAANAQAPTQVPGFADSPRVVAPTAVSAQPAGGFEP
jgi:hypothetical protein